MSSSCAWIRGIYLTSIKYGTKSIAIASYIYYSIEVIKMHSVLFVVRDVFFTISPVQICFSAVALTHLRKNLSNTSSSDMIYCLSSVWKEGTNNVATETTEICWRTLMAPAQSADSRPPVNRIATCCTTTGRKRCAAWPTTLQLTASYVQVMTAAVMCLQNAVHTTATNDVIVIVYTFISHR